MPFEPIKITGRAGGAWLSIDKSYRLRLSNEAKEKLAITPFTPFVVSVDVENKRIGLVKQELAKIPDVRVVKIDKRGYVGTKVGKDICDKLAMLHADLPRRFEYVGRIDEGTVFWEAFQLSK